MALMLDVGKTINFLNGLGYGEAAAKLQNTIQMGQQACGVLQDVAQQGAGTSLATTGGSTAGGGDHQPGGACCDACKVGAPCNGGTPQCVGNQCNTYWGKCMFPNTAPGAVPFMQIPGEMYPGCYECDCIDPCLAPLLLEARKWFDDFAWQALWSQESEIVHINKDVGAHPPYNVYPGPLSSNESFMLAQESKQQLPYVPGLIKVDGKFAADPGLPGNIKFQFYTGEVGIVDIPADPTTVGLVAVSREYDLTDFECKNDCYFLRWPRLNGCKVRGMPYRRAIYLKVTAKDLGDNQLSSLTVTIIKQATEMCRVWSTRFQWPFKLGCAGY